MKLLTGSCLCGKVDIEIPDEFEYMGNCHCSDCRKFTGSNNTNRPPMLVGGFRLNTTLKKLQFGLLRRQGCQSSVVLKSVWKKRPFTNSNRPPMLVGGFLG